MFIDKKAQHCQCQFFTFICVFNSVPVKTPASQPVDSNTLIIKFTLKKNPEEPVQEKTTVQKYTHVNIAN